jgi:hypothetical protein
MWLLPAFRGTFMSSPISSIHESDEHGQNLINEIVQRFTDLLVAGGASMPMIEAAMTQAVECANDRKVTTKFTELGSLLRDCMEVMCTWRRDIDFVDENGEPRPLSIGSHKFSFETLCARSKCRHSPTEIVNALLEFGAVSQSQEGTIQSETPTFLVGRATSGGKLATDALIKHLQGFLHCVHRNVCSFSGDGKPKFERACTVTVARELEPVFDRLVRYRGQEFIDSIDEWLERNRKVESPSGRYVELGAGAYFVDLGDRVARK